MPRYFLDTEFVNDALGLNLISIALVCDDGREYYAQSLDAPLERSNAFVQKHVWPGLTNVAGWEVWMGKKIVVVGDNVRLATIRSEDLTKLGVGFTIGPAWQTDDRIAEDLVRFVDPETYGRPEIWGYYCDYDWVLVTRLFGDFESQPKGWPWYCRDLKQWCDMLGGPRLPALGKGEHNALFDARWNKVAYEYLEGFAVNRQCAHAGVPAREDFTWMRGN
jgi:hypothetical protein